MRYRASLSLIAAVILAIASSTAVADDRSRPPGPLRIRDMTPPAILTLGFKPATADARRFLSNGHTDVGLQLMLQRTWQRSGLYLSGSYV